MFVDVALPLPLFQTFTYRVTAIDTTGNESTPSNEVQANVP